MNNDKNWLKDFLRLKDTCKENYVIKLIYTMFVISILMLGVTYKYADKHVVQTNLVDCSIVDKGNISRYSCYFIGDEYSRTIDVNRFEYNYYTENKDKPFNVEVEHDNFIFLVINIAMVLGLLLAIVLTKIED